MKNLVLTICLVVMICLGMLLSGCTDGMVQDPKNIQSFVDSEKSLSPEMISSAVKDAAKELVIRLDHLSILQNVAIGAWEKGASPGAITNEVSMVALDLGIEPQMATHFAIKLNANLKALKTDLVLNDTQNSRKYGVLRGSGEYPGLTRANIAQRYIGGVTKNFESEDYKK